MRKCLLLMPLWLVFISPDLALAQENLEPERGSFARRMFLLEYDKQLKSLLGSDEQLTGFTDFVMMSCQPAESPEWTISLTKSKDTDSWRMTYRTADSQIWASFVEQEMGKGKREVKVTETSTSLNPETASLVFRVISGEVLKTKYDLTDPDEQVTDTDGYHFVAYRNQRCLCGTTQSPSRGSRMDKLVKLGVQMRQVATTSGQARQEHEAELIAICNQLLPKPEARNQAK